MDDVSGGGVGEGCTRGMGTGGYWEGTIPGTTQDPSQGPIYSLIARQGPTYGQMKAILEVSTGSLDKGPERVQNRVQN